MQKLLWLTTFLWGSWAGLLAAELQLEGLPMQMRWVDLTGDGRKELLVMMLRTQTVGDFQTYFEDGQLMGSYEDDTFTDRYFEAYSYEKQQWNSLGRVDLGRKKVLGFARSHTNQVVIWTADGLELFDFVEGRARAGGVIPTPGIAQHAPMQLSGHSFWHQQGERGFWLVPDLDRLHFVGRDGTRLQMPYPLDLEVETRKTETAAQVTLSLPTPAFVDGDQTPEWVFQGKQQIIAASWPESQRPAYRQEQKDDSMLVDLNNDRMVDLIEIEHKDIERRKDLPNAKSHIKTYLARGPLQFEEEPDVEQEVPGIIFNELAERDNQGDFSLKITEPFFDINGDGRMDLAGFAFKVGMWQLVRVVSTGRLTLKFFLHLSLQQPDGSFVPLAGGPFEMKWKINIRRLEMPSFAQLTADFDGDGWVDILHLDRKKLEIIPLTASGFGFQKTKTLRLPRAIRDPEQFYGEDVDADGKAEVVLLQIRGRQTQVHVLEVSQ